MRICLVTALLLVSGRAVGSPDTGANASSTSGTAELRLQVMLVNDPDFPAVTRSDAAAILEEARLTLADKLGFGSVNFEVIGESNAAAFLNRNITPNDACMDRLGVYRVRPDGRLPSDVPREVVLRFLHRWKVEELRAFFPADQQKSLSSYELIYAALMTEYHKKLKLLAGFRLKNGRSLLDPATLDRRSYVRWICAIRHQNEADLLLTNAFILYDLGSEPYPHSIFAKGKVGGASLYSDERRAIRNRAVMSSTFSMVTAMPYFREAGVEHLSPAERLEVIGTFIVAHELGHAVFKLPDFYDHPKECLMTTKYETGYVSGYENIKKYPGACTQCAPYVAAKRHVFEADAAQLAGDLTAAIAHLKDAIRTTPKHVDGNYLRYMAGLTVRVADLYAKRGQRRQSRRWLKSALRIVPNDERALGLQQRLDAIPAGRSLD